MTSMASEDDTREEASAPEERKSLTVMTREELSEDGFVFGDDLGRGSRARAIVLAATAGLVVHGVGHWYVNDRQTALVLMGMQGLSMAMLGTALGGYLWGQDNAWGSSRVISPLILVGGGLFVLSYLIDVVGTIYSDELGLPENTHRTRGISVVARYTYIKPDHVFLRHFLLGEVRLDLGRFYGATRTLQEVGLDLSTYGATVGWRPWQGTLPLTHVFMEVDSDYLVQRADP
ncbi:MAG: hypothetical protein ACNA8W_04630 [Bradymonadaceae bacterium]